MEKCCAVIGCYENNLKEMIAEKRVLDDWYGNEEFCVD